jgi:predicted dehydrogenase
MSLSLPLTSRRDFLKTAATASLLAIPAFVPSSALAAPNRTGANGKIRVGLIGAGNRAKWLSRCMARENARAELIAVCDCYLSQVNTLAADYENNARAKPRWTAYQNYAEKPLHFSIPEGRALVQAVRKYERVLQVGTQQRSTANNIYSCKFVRDGGLGRVHTILVMNYSGAQPSTGLQSQAIPEGMDWNRFCAQAPLLEYNENLHRKWRRYDAFTGGPICDRGAHALDMVHLAMGWENVAPTRIVPTTPADNYWGRGVRLYYPDGTVVRLESKDGPAFGGIFIGQRGKIEINRGRFACNPTNLLAQFEGPDTESHVANWLDCVQSRKDPNAPVEVGHLITSVSHLINICRIVGRPIEWDATEEQITNDNEANDLLVKVRRPEFGLPAFWSEPVHSVN